MEATIKNEVQEQLNELSKDDPKHIDGLKPEINSLLHTYLPENTTIKESDALAMAILDMITNPETYLNP